MLEYKLLDIEYRLLEKEKGIRSRKRTLLGYMCKKLKKNTRKESGISTTQNKTKFSISMNSENTKAILPKREITNEADVILIESEGQRNSSSKSSFNFPSPQCDLQSSSSVVHEDIQSSFTINKERNSDNKFLKNSSERCSGISTGQPPNSVRRTLIRPIKSPLESPPRKRRRKCKTRPERFPIDKWREKILSHLGLPFSRHTESPDRSWSRSPIRNRSKSPAFSGNSIYLRRSKEDCPKSSIFLRNLIRNRSRSPIRKWSGNLIRNKSRSPVEYRSKKPLHRKELHRISRSITKNGSKSSNGTFSRSSSGGSLTTRSGKSFSVSEKSSRSTTKSPLPPAKSHSRRLEYMMPKLHKNSDSNLHDSNSKSSSFKILYEKFMKQLNETPIPGVNTENLTLEKFKQFLLAPDLNIHTMTNSQFAVNSTKASFPNVQKTSQQTLLHSLAAKFQTLTDHSNELFINRNFNVLFPSLAAGIVQSSPSNQSLTHKLPHPFSLASNTTIPPFENLSRVEHTSNPKSIPTYINALSPVDKTYSSLQQAEVSQFSVPQQLQILIQHPRIQCEQLFLPTKPRSPREVVSRDGMFQQFQNLSNFQTHKKLQFPVEHPCRRQFDNQINRKVLPETMSKDLEQPYPFDMNSLKLKQEKQNLAEIVSATDSQYFFSKCPTASKFGLLTSSTENANKNWPSKFNTNSLKMKRDKSNSPEIVTVIDSENELNKSSTAPKFGL